MYVGKTLQHLGKAERVRAIFEHLAGEKAVQGAIDVGANLHVLVFEHVA